MLTWHLVLAGKEILHFFHNYKHAPGHGHTTTWYKFWQHFKVIIISIISGSKFDLDVKMVKVNPISSFEQTLLGPRPQCCIPSPKVISPLVLEKSYEGFFPYMGMVAILVTWPGSFEQTLVPPSNGAPYEIWLWLAQWFQRRRHLKSVDGEWIDDRACLFTISSPMSLKAQVSWKY